METKPNIKPKRSEALIKAQKKYYEKNKKKIIAYTVDYNIENVHSKIYNCECGISILDNSKYRHFKTKRHLDGMELLNIF